MAYNQKYCLAHFINPIQKGTKFHMNEWPLHITLADVFEIDRISSNIEEKLNHLLEQVAPVKSCAVEDAVLGVVPVVLLEKTTPLVFIHEKIMDLLEANGALFNTPEFTHAGFLPHSTIQPSGKLSINDEVIINSVSLVDMFPDGDWQQRKILANINLL